MSHTQWIRSVDTLRCLFISMPYFSLLLTENDLRIVKEFQVKCASSWFRRGEFKETLSFW